MRFKLIILTLVCLGLVPPNDLLAAEVKAGWQAEWETTLDAAKKEGKIVAGVPASADLRKNLTQAFNARYPGIEVELASGRGPTNASKIAAEHAAGVRYYDVLLSGTLTPLSLLNAGILEAIEPLFILPEVRDSKRWYGGMSGPTPANAFSIPSRPINRKIFGTTLRR